MLIDTHAHLFWPSYKDDLEGVLARARNAGVEKIIVPGSDIATSRQAIELAKKHPGVLYAAVGVHPEETLSYKSSDHSPIIAQGSELRELITQNKELVVAIGETGIDLYTPEVQATLSQQKELFRKQLELAVELNLPVIIHTRNSFPETWEVLSSLPAMPRGQFHCFSVDEAALHKVVEVGFCVSFCGNITWSKRVASMVKLIPEDRLLLETDSPFMIPRITKVPNSPSLSLRSAESSEPGQGSELGINEPANVRILAEKIAELRGTSLETIAEITTGNAKRLYRL